MRRSFIALGLASLAVCVPAAAGASAPQFVPAPAYPGPTLPGLTVPLLIIPGSPFTLTGTNFEPGCNYEVRVNTKPSQVLSLGTVSGSGGVSTVLSAPPLAAFVAADGSLMLTVTTLSPCTPEVANVNLVVELPPTL